MARRKWRNSQSIQAKAKTEPDAKDLRVVPTSILGPRPTADIKPDVSQLGASGTTVFGGILTQQDYNPILTYPMAYDIFDEMRKSDPTVRALLNALTLPLLAAEWSIIPPDDTDEQKEIAQLLTDDLFSMRTTWMDWLRQALLHVVYGVMLFEKIWEYRDNKVRLVDLAPRLPRSIIYWFSDEYGQFNGVRQNAFFASGLRIVDIGPEKLLRLTNEQEGADFRGLSVLRACYMPWFYKSNFYKIQAVAIEKRAMGIDVATLQGMVDENVKASAQAAMMTLHAHQKNSITEVKQGKDGDGFSYRIEGAGQGSLLDPMPAIEHHDVRILRSMMAEFLAMLGGSGGSRSMHQDKTSFFLMILQAVSKKIEDTVSQELIKQWTDYNWDVDKYCRLECSRLETRDISVFAMSALQLSQAGILTPDDDLENQVRDWFDLPTHPDPYSTDEDPDAAPTPPSAGGTQPTKPVRPTPSAGNTTVQQAPRVPAPGSRGTTPAKVRGVGTAPVPRTGVTRGGVAASKVRFIQMPDGRMVQVGRDRVSA